MRAVSVRTSEKKTRIVNVHQQLTCGEQRCTTVIVDGTTSCNLEGALYCVVLQDRTFDSQHETSLRHLFLPGRSSEAGPQH